MNKKKNKKSFCMSAVPLAIGATIIMVTALTMAGNLEPTAPPGPTMKTLNEIPPTWSQTIPLASDRFELVLYDEAVLDKETGLVWARNANLFNVTTQFFDALGWCTGMEIGGRMGWRLPTIEELLSLVDPRSSDPALPPGFSAFFDNVQNAGYWSSTQWTTNTAYGVNMTTGSHGYYRVDEFHRIWPVRGGSGQIIVR